MLSLNKSTIDGMRAGDFLEWQAKFCTDLSLYNILISNVLQGVKRLSSENTGGVTDRATWDMLSLGLWLRLSGLWGFVSAWLRMLTSVLELRFCSCEHGLVWHSRVGE